MTNATILEKAIEKVLYEDPICFGVSVVLLSVYEQGGLLFVTVEIDQTDGTTELVDLEYKSAIFNHDFAKVFFGKYEICGYCGENLEESGESCLGSNNCQLSCNYPNPIPIWKYHLQQMVLEEDPIKYLEKFL
ncbi:MAG TPA: hypothetical protein ENI61_01110 [Ignavibacteria bacterium]|nr:hypothetical protein [Ignavibacteria bacterium]